MAQGYCKVDLIQTELQLHLVRMATICSYTSPIQMDGFKDSGQPVDLLHHRPDSKPQASSVLNLKTLANTTIKETFGSRFITIYFYSYGNQNASA